MEHHTKTKGDLAVLHAQVSLAEQGWLVCLPLTEHAPFDLLAYKDGEYRRVQVKHTRKRHGAIMARWSKYQGKIDTMCLFEPSSKMCFYVPALNSSTVTIRLEASKNNQHQGVRPADEFLMLK